MLLLRKSYLGLGMMMGMMAGAAAGAVPDPESVVHGICS